MTEYDKCLASAQKSLAMREHSKFQLINKLKNKSFDTDTINSVLEHLHNSGFQSDERYTEEYIRYRQNSGYSYEKIVYELKSNGISSDVININLCKFSDDYDVLFEFAKLTSNKSIVKVMSDEYSKCVGEPSDYVFKIMWKYTCKFQYKYLRKKRIKKKLMFWKK